MNWPLYFTVLPYDVILAALLASCLLAGWSCLLLVLCVAGGSCWGGDSHNFYVVVLYDPDTIDVIICAAAQAESVLL